MLTGGLCRLMLDKTYKKLDPLTQKAQLPASRYDALLRQRHVLVRRRCCST